MASLITSCPTFFFFAFTTALLLLGKRGHVLPKMHHDLAFVWPRPPWCECLAAGGVTYRPLSSNQNPRLWLTGCDWCWGEVGQRNWRSAAERTQQTKTTEKRKKKIRHNTTSLLIREVGQCPTFHDSSCFIGQKALWRSRCVRPALKQHFFFYSPPLFRDNSGRLALFTGHWQSREVKPSP